MPEMKTGTIMNVILYSFGFKHAMPEAETVIDVRFLPNPYYVPELSSRTGLEKEVSSYVLDTPIAHDFFQHLKSFFLSYIQQHGDAEKNDMRIAVGCTGGRHRSVAVVEQLKNILIDNGVAVESFHRDIEKV